MTKHTFIAHVNEPSLCLTTVSLLGNDHPEIIGEPLHQETREQLQLLCPSIGNWRLVVSDRIYRDDVLALSKIGSANGACYYAQHHSHAIRLCTKQLLALFDTEPQRLYVHRSKLSERVVTHYYGVEDFGRLLLSGHGIDWETATKMCAALTLNPHENAGTSWPSAITVTNMPWVHAGNSNYGWRLCPYDDGSDEYVTYKSARTDAPADLPLPRELLHDDFGPLPEILFAAPIL